MKKPRIKVTFWTSVDTNENLKLEAEKLGISKSALMNLKLNKPYEG